MIGLAKVMYSTSVASLGVDYHQKASELALYLTERLDRQKASSHWPVRALKRMQADWGERLIGVPIAENRDTQDPWDYERSLDKQFPFFAHLKKEGLESYTRAFNPQIKFLSHHYAHALVAEMFSPFEKALICVADGAGSRVEGRLEEMSFYRLDKTRPEGLTPLQKYWQNFIKGTHHPSYEWSEGVGMFYERAAQYIFGSNQAAGKVMGLAALSTERLERGSLSRASFLDQLEWQHAFQGKTKRDWEQSAHQSLYQKLARTTQDEFEAVMFERIEKIKKRYPDLKNLILTGGCALNCTFNGKLRERGLFEEMYVPAFPGDGGLALGLAYFGHPLRRAPNKPTWSHETQVTALGPFQSENIDTYFRDYQVERLAGLDEVCRLLERGEVIAWFQGRSESGPRALGHRSLIAKVDRPGLKDFLNTEIKFRENFRPYGCSVLFEDAAKYFDVPHGFHNPFMSFALRVRNEYKNLLQEVTHVDGTSRMQTVHEGANLLFRELLLTMRKMFGHGVVLNTSLNIMGEPIVETLGDLERFMEHPRVNHAVVGNHLISKSHRT